MRITTTPRRLATRRVISYRVRLLISNVVACITMCFYSFPLNYQLRTAQARQTTCTNPPLLGQRYTFPQNTDVRVNISGSYSAEEFGCIRQAFLNWQANSGTASGVRYTEITHGGTPVAGGANTIQVWRERPPLTATGQQPQADMTPTFNGANTNLSSAVIRVHPDVNNCTALAEAMAHELGHTYGLDDCNACANNSSTMTGYNNMNDVDSGTTSPSTCDADAARQAGAYNPATSRGPQPREPNNSGYTGGYNRQGFTGYNGPFNRMCYAAFLVTTYYSCGSSGCSYVGSNSSFMGIYCY